MKKLPFVLLLAFATASTFALPGPTSASFAKGAKFTVAGYTGASTLSGFPVLVRIAENSPSGFSYDDLQSKATGDDIAFVDMDGTGLPFEIDTWDPNGTSLIWVRLPSMQSGTEFVMCWGSASSGKAVCNANPWSAFTGVWHMGETGTPSSSNPVTIHDSTANGLDGSTLVVKAADESVIGGAWRIAEDQNHDRAIRVPVGGSGADPAKKAAADALGTDFHASFWVRAKGVVQWSNLICRRKGDQGTGWGFSFHENSGGAPKLMRVYAGGTTPATTSGDYNLGATLSKTDNVWKKVDVVWKFASNNNAQVADLYLNGAYVETVTCLETVNQQDTDIGIGCSTQDSYNSSDTNKKGRRANAEMDEVRLGAFVPSADWIAADYATQASSSFLTAGMAEPYGATDDPVAGVQASDVAYTNATVTATVVKRGGAATSADVTVELATASDFAAPLWTTNYTVSADGDVQAFPVAGLSFGTSYYLRAVVSNTLDAVLTTSATSFTTPTPGSPAGTATFQERGFTTLSATGAATAFGTGAQSATLRLEASTDGFATIAGASAEVSAVAGAAETALTVSNLVPATSYALRLRIRNDWGVDTFVALPDAATRAVPFATTGLGWTFSADGSTVDVTFGVSGIYDGASGTATLYYGESANPTASQGDRPVAAAGDLLWPGLPVSAETMYAKVVLSATLGGQVFSETYTAPISAGSTAVSVSDFANHQSAEDSVRVRVGDVVTLPELTGTDFYYLGNNRFGSLEGNVLTATEPGILGVFRVTDAGATTNTLPVIVLPEKIGNGDIYILKDNSIGNSWGYWDEAAKWEKVGSDTNDSWPHNPDDIAILGYWRNTGSISFEPRSGDVSLGALYLGNFRNAEAKLIFRYRNKVVFSRTDGKPALIQFCANDRLTAKGATLSFQDSIAGVEFPCGVVIDGGWDGVENRCPRAYFEFKAPSFLLPEGKTLLLQNFSPSRDGEGSSFEKPFKGGGLVWNRSAANFNWTGESLSGFTGTLRDSSHGAASFGYQAPLFVRSPGSNTVAEVIGFVSANTDANPQVSSSSVGILQTGFNQNYRDALLHQDPWFTGRGLLLHGGTYQANAIEHVWGYGKADKKIGDVLALSGGLTFLKRSWSRDQLSGYPINWVEFKSLVHEDKSSLVLWGDFWSNGAISTADKTITIDVPKGGPVITETIPAGSVRTNHVTILSGISSHAIGPNGDPRTTALHPVVPWILSPVNNSGDGWNALGFAAFDENGWLVAPLRAEVTSLTADAAVPGANVAIHDRNIEISADVTVNSLLVNNQNKGKTLGEGRTLTVTSGGLILHGSGAIGTEAGGAANGSLVLGDATHPAYVWARGKTSGPNQLWAPVTAPGGFVSAYTGNLVLGGNQTNILDELVVNAGTLQLGTATTSCRLARGLPIRIYANATLKLPNADSTSGKILQFDGAAGWFGKVESADGVAAKCKMAFVRDYPESPEWETLPRGVYGSSASAATGEFVRDDLFTGSGTLEVITDDRVVPSVMILR